ncbi:hypothetical protein BX600DRAFT_519364 [Xylariales sp. PMI_506]|nr:hypothetical protein BX600DRAFT_519364 [Xylariales sp. PMI_506]
MAEYVEAQSLASLNALASNPPQYPTNPTGKKHEPLVLYISRVPGTRDIILSTFRPQLKNVTSEDVASSLYYVHLDTPEDELLAVAHSEGAPSRPSLESSRSGNVINRKPVSGASGPVNPSIHADSNSLAPGIHGAHPESLHTRREPSPLRSAQFPAATPQQPLHALSSAVAPPTTYQPYQQQPDQRPPQPPIHRKPIGPPAVATIDTRSTGGPDPPPHYELPPPPLPVPRPQEYDRHQYDYATGHGGDLQVPALPQRPDTRSVSPSKRNKAFTPFSLTLIRRDPSSSQQWNVGKIASFQLQHPEDVPDGKHVPSPTIMIHLETSGYAKFRGLPAPGTAFDLAELRQSLDMVRPGSSSVGGGASAAVAGKPPSSSRPYANKSAATTGSAAGGSPTGALFERQVKMTYGPSWTANIRNAFRRRGSREDDAAAATAIGGPHSPPAFPASPLRQHRHERQGSATSIGSFGGDFDGGEAPVITVPGHGLRPQGYMFFSPWDGRCEFRTGNGGRSLRCRHYLPTFGAQWNPLVGSGGGGGGEGGGRDGDDRSHFHRPRSSSGGGGPKSPKASKGLDISELRFNLPSNEIFSSSSGESGSGRTSPREGRERTRDRILNAMINKTEDDLDDDEYERYGGGGGMFDLSLGREKAGGGNRGKRAKMGKLIVWDDGLKMLDLVVAANVGIWWSVWERKSE